MRTTRLALGLALLAVPACAPAQLAETTGGNSPSPTPAVTDGAIPTTTMTPLPSNLPSATPPPTHRPSLVTGFGFNDILRAEVNGLAVRVSPTLESPLAQGRSLSGEQTGDVRLDAGDYVSVELGPLPIGDVVWYLVWPAEDARLNYSTEWWDTNGDNPEGGVNPGWVAASVGEDRYLSLFRVSNEYSPFPEGGPTTLTVSGTGDYVSDPQTQFDLFSFEWAAAVHEGSGPCPFAVTLLPADGAEPKTAIETTVAEVDHGPLFGQASIVNALWERTSGAVGDALFTVSVRSTCAWSLKLAPMPHD